MRDALWLVKNGIPFDVAFGLDEATRSAWCIMFCEFAGAKFNWNSMQFEDRE
jgi:hypothetical protein